LLRIRLTRTGKKNRPSYRIVVAEHTAPIQGKFIEVVGFYSPIENPKQLEFKEDRIKYWISVGAQPTDTVASLLKSKGMENMDQYLSPRDKKRKKKGEEEAPEAVVAPSVAPAAEEAPIEKAAEQPRAEEVKEEKPAEEAPTEKPTAEADEVKEEKPAEEAKEEKVEEVAEETKDKDEKKEEAPEAPTEETA